MTITTLRFTSKKGDTKRNKQNKQDDKGYTDGVGENDY